MFVLNPDPFLLPAYRISPFQTCHLVQNTQYTESNFAQNYFDNRFGQNKWMFTFNGREAIRLALQQYHLKPLDVVTILTTSENFYISSCVTKTIEEFCQWNRTVTHDTKVIIVNHEFGYPHPKIQEILALGLPIIEDCCTTFFSQDTAHKVGQYGNFTTYSFPKFFPIQIGGLLVSNQGFSQAFTTELNHNEQVYIEKILSHYLSQNDSIIAQRKDNFQYAAEAFQKIGFSLRFESSDSVVPSVLMLNNHHQIKDLPALKVFLANHGIQSSVFYGEDAFFIPCHQHLNTTDIDYFIQVIHYYQQNFVNV